MEKKIDLILNAVYIYVHIKADCVIQNLLKAVLSQFLNTMKKYTSCPRFLFNVASGLLISPWSMHICHYFQMALSHRCHGTLTICLQWLPVSSGYHPRVEFLQLALWMNGKYRFMSHHTSWIDRKPQLDSSLNWHTVVLQLAVDSHWCWGCRFESLGFVCDICWSFPSQPRMRWHRLVAKLFRGVSEWGWKTGVCGSVCDGREKKKDMF